MKTPRLASAATWSVLAATALVAAAVSTSHAQTFTNPAAITIRDNNTATPYPATITVSGISSPIFDLNVSIFGFSHTFSDDVGILLVGPGGQQVILDGRVGASSPVTNANITFDDQAASGLPAPLTSGTFRPTLNPDVTPDLLAFAAPAPAYNGNLLLSVFNGTSANGIWKLYVQDFNAVDVGNISNGYSLSFTVPEPSTWALLGVGAAGLGLTLCRQHRRPRAA